jgi:uncharacterized protein YdiU (UPF0061 family)
VITFEDTQPILNTLILSMRPLFPLMAAFRVFENPFYPASGSDDWEEFTPWDGVEIFLTGEFCLRCHFLRESLNSFIQKPSLISFLCEKVAQKFQLFQKNCQKECSEDWLFLIDEQCLVSYAEKRCMDLMNELIQKIHHKIPDSFPFFTDLKETAKPHEDDTNIVKKVIVFRNLKTNTSRRWPVFLDKSILEAYANPLTQDETIKKVEKLMLQQINNEEKSNRE